MELLIVEKSGWSKSLKIDRAVIRVGSASSNDIQLQSPEIAAVHIQIFNPSVTDSYCKVVNLAHEIAVKVSRDIHKLPSFASVNVRDGDEILLDGYSITFRLPQSTNVLKPARKIQGNLCLTEAFLRPEHATTGVLTIMNAGEQSGCQFKVEVQGLPADCYQIDPIPLMYQGAQEDVRVQFFHRTHYPSAGLQTILIKLSSPESYPGEELLIRQEIYVAPVFRQVLELFDDLNVVERGKENKVIPAPFLGSAPVTHSNASGRLSDIQIPAESAIVSFPHAPSMEPPSFNSLDQQKPLTRETNEQAASDNFQLISATPMPDVIQISQNGVVRKPTIPDVSRLKIVREPSNGDGFWDEE